MFDLYAVIGADHPFLLAALIYVSSFFDFRRSPPDYFAVDDVTLAFTEDWLEEYAKTCQQGVILRWGNENRKRFEYQQNNALVIQLDNFAKTPERVIECLQFYPWTIASFFTRRPEVSRTPLLHDDFYKVPRSLRWGMTFKGKGHNLLPSRRYIVHGPWRILRNEAQDITLIQFHDVNANIPTSLEQAKPGHQFMGLMGERMGTVLLRGEYRDYGEDEISKLLAFYNPSERMLLHIISDRPIVPAELLEACEARILQPLGKDQLIERVGYLFVNQEEAWQNLHELWLRELECWTMIEGKKVRLDEDYTPPLSQKPEWVKRIEAQYSSTTSR
jgi:hypothetical protein